MGLKEKSKANTKLAYELKENAEFNSSVNRFYYSIFQKLSHLASNKWDYEFSSLDGSSHESLIKFVESEIEKKKEDRDSRFLAIRAMQVKGSFKKIKSLRVQADYSEDDIEEIQMSECVEHLKKFNQGYDALSNL